MDPNHPFKGGSPHEGLPVLRGWLSADLGLNILPLPSKRKLTFNLLDPDQAIETSQKQPKKGVICGCKRSILGPKRLAEKLSSSPHNR